MEYVECPKEHVYDGKLTVFLAGGISGCYDWQNEVVHLLKDTDFTILNPRRQSFDKSNKEVEREQIEWEFNHLMMADIISFWFSPETVCPITLFEYGKHLVTRLGGHHKLILGIHPDYSRKTDLEIQTSLYAPDGDIPIVYDLKSLAEEIKKMT